MIRAGIAADLGHVGELHCSASLPSSPRSGRSSRRSTTTRVGSPAASPSRMNARCAMEELFLAPYRNASWRNPLRIVVSMHSGTFTVPCSTRSKIPADPLLNT